MSALVVLWAVSAAAECPQVKVDFRGGRWTDELTQRVAREVELESRRAGLCDSAHHVAVSFIWEQEEPIGLVVGFRRDAAEQQLRRRFDPTQLPEDGLPLALASVVGELFQEALLPPHSATPPPSPSSSSWGVGVRAGGLGAADSFSGDGEVFGRVSWGRLGVQLLLGGGGGSAAAAEAGTVELARVLLGLSALVRLWSNERWELGAEAGLVGGPWWLTPRPTAGWTGTASQAWAFDVRAGLELGLRFERLLLLASAGVDAPLRPVRVTDGTTELASPIDWAAYFTLGAAFTW